MANHRVLQEERRCLVCGAAFLVGGVTGKKRSQKSCSLSCATRRSRRVHVRQQITTLAPLDAAYLAGYVDADGSMGLYWKRQYLTPQVSISSVTYPLLTWVRDAVGAGSVQDMRNSDPRRRTSYQWVLTGQACDALLSQLVPHLRVKAEQARLIREYIALVADDPVHVDGTLYREQIMALNKKGPR